MNDQRNHEHRPINAGFLKIRQGLRVPWTARRSNQSILKISPGISLEGMMLKLNPVLWPPHGKELTHWKRLWEGLGAGGEGDDQELDGWMASRTWWTWVWVNSGSWWWTGRPGMLQFMGSQRVGHNWATELNWTELRERSLELETVSYSFPFLVLDLGPPMCTQSLVISLWLWIKQRLVPLH